ncbi:RNA polymerase sigma factor [Streptomyces tendae]|uniref:RNA polymerase sigma factor n=1 Tax=Streptomyces tendae TaxID=1932 RepID=UPI0038124C9D
MAENYGGTTAADLAALYEGHHREMEGFARRLLADERLPESTLSAEDVVQTAFTKALNAPTGIRDPRAYLYVVIRNDVRAASRQVRRQTTVTSMGAWLDQPTEVHVADFSNLVANRLTVHRALGNLPPQQRTAVWATKALEYTQAEAAEIMQKRPGTIATHVMRAVAALRVHLTALVVVGITTLCLEQGRALREMQAPADSPRAPLPQAPSISTLLYGALSFSLVAASAGWAFRWWTRRRQAMAEGGTFAPRPLTEVVREALEARRFQTDRATPPRRRTVSEEELAEEEIPSGLTRMRLPE